MDSINISHLRNSFTYFPETGELVRSKNNKLMNSLDVYGYIQVYYSKKMYKAHRLIWAITYGEMPQGQIDHINGIRSDNKISNLRVVTQQQNSFNKTKKSKSNQSGYRGVCWNKRANKWQSSISVNGKNIYLGVFTSIESARQAYLEAKKIHHAI
jgi:hypothetical protein